MPPKKPRVQGKKSRSTKRQDFVYENPPLVEVIAEVHWGLHRLPSIDGAIDPHFPDFLDRFRRAAKSKGFSHEELVVPAEAPLEFFGGQVTRRFRPKGGGWPLYQIGPGVMSINIVPPYRGWEEFRPIIRQGFELLLKAHIGLKSSANFNRIQLRYINAFDEEFGMQHPGDFVRDELKLGVEVPTKLKASLRKGDANIQHEGRLMTLLGDPDGAAGVLSWNKGKKEDREAVIVQIDIRAGDKSVPKTVRNMMTWLDKAHAAVHTWFHAIVSPNIAKKLGKKVTI